MILLLILFIIHTITIDIMLIMNSLKHLCTAMVKWL